MNNRAIPHTKYNNEFKQEILDKHYKEGYSSNYLAREYILRMESKGYMSRQDGYELINKLQERGFYNVNFSGSTTTPPGYGKEITLSINAKVKIKKYMINKLLDVTDLTESSQIRIVKKSTAKY